MGYGYKKKVNLTGAVGTVNAKKLENRPVTNLSVALQGTVPGMVVIQRSGQPGKDNATIRIRGIGTLNNANPLVLVDGIESSMNDIDPDNIESISVLKDAASASIYGSKAANGVILITTKKGTLNTPMQLTYRTNIGWQKPTRLPEYLSSWEYAELFNEARRNDGLSDYWTASDIEHFKKGDDPDNFPNTDWLGLFYTGSGFQQHHFIDFSGGSNSSQYMVSFGYLDQKGIIQNSSNNKYNVRANFSTKIKEKLKLDINLSGSNSNVIEPTNPYTGDMAQIFRQVNRISPWVPYKYSNGYYGYINDGNPIAWQDLKATNNSNYYRTLTKFQAEYELFKGFKVKGVYAFRGFFDIGKKFIKDIQYYDHNTGNPTLYQGPNSLNDYRAQSFTSTWQAMVNYDKIINKHHFHILGGYQQELQKYGYTNGYRQRFMNNELHELNAGSTDGQKATGSANELALRSYFGRVNYNYAGKYLIEANLRYDGTSRLSAQNRWGVFPSVSAGWRISEESFLSNLSWLNNLKLRASWGTLGNQNALSLYPTISTISLGQNYDFGGGIAVGASPTSAANKDIKWESTTSYDAGLDIGLFNSLNFTIDYFNKLTTDILLKLPVSYEFGLGAPVQNAGKIKNTGFEFNLNYSGKAGSFKYNLGLNFAMINNQITDLKGIEPVVNGLYVWDLGDPVHAFYGYEVEGIFQSQEEVDSHATQTGGNIGPGDLMYKDQNNDGVINGEDRVYMGSPDPRYTFGFNLGANFKGFDFSVFLQGAAAVNGYLMGEAIGGTGGFTEKPTSIFRDRWTPEYPNNKFPRVHTTSNRQNSPWTYSSFWMQDASYLRLKNIQFGYNLPASALNALKISSLRIYYSGQNIFTLTKMNKGFDPEAPATRGNYYPQVKVNSLGIDVKF